MYSMENSNYLDFSTLQSDTKRMYTEDMNTWVILASFGALVLNKTRRLTTVVDVVIEKLR